MNATQALEVRHQVRDLDYKD